MTEQEGRRLAQSLIDFADTVAESLPTPEIRLAFWTTISDQAGSRWFAAEDGTTQPPANLG